MNTTSIILNDAEYDEMDLTLYLDNKKVFESKYVNGSPNECYFALQNQEQNLRIEAKITKKGKVHTLMKSWQLVDISFFTKAFFSHDLTFAERMCLLMNLQTEFATKYAQNIRNSYQEQYDETELNDWMSDFFPPLVEKTKVSENLIQKAKQDFGVRLPDKIESLFAYQFHMRRGFRVRLPNDWRDVFKGRINQVATIDEAKGWFSSGVNQLYENSLVILADDDSPAGIAYAPYGGIRDVGEDIRYTKFPHVHCKEPSFISEPNFDNSTPFWFSIDDHIYGEPEVWCDNYKPMDIEQIILTYLYFNMRILLDGLKEEGIFGFTQQDYVYIDTNNPDDQISLDLRYDGKNMKYTSLCNIQKFL